MDTTAAYAWVTHAPNDYTMIFRADPGGEHAIVSGWFDEQQQARRVCEELKGGAVGGNRLDIYCALRGEAERVRARLGEDAVRTSIERGEIHFVAVGGGWDPVAEGARGEAGDARMVWALGGAGPRHYRFTRQCPTCGELLGKIHVLPQDGVMIDTSELSCRCRSIPCRYCEGGSVRRPVTEHCDPERRAGRMPWYGYLVPCGDCQVAGRGPRVVMSAPLEVKGDA